MAWQEAKYKLTSVCQMLMHNGQTADPTNKWSKLIKQISSKRAKTDSDYEEMARLEFMAGLYMSADGPVLPNFMVDAILVAGAKKSKEGQLAKSAVFCTSHVPLVYDGPRTADGLWGDERFRFSAIVRVQNARVSRTRPRFEKWEALAVLKYEPSVINLARIDDWLTVAGAMVGAGDWRPQNGRFEVVRVS